MVTAPAMRKVSVLGQWKGVPVFLLLSSSVLSSYPPILCQLAGSFALLVGSDLRKGYGEGILKEESSFLSMVFFGKSHVYQEVRWLWCT